MLQCKILVRKATAVYTYSTSSIPVLEVSALDHERFDHSVELAALVADRVAAPLVFPATELPKVLGRLRTCVCKELYLHPTSRYAADSDIKEYHWITP